MNRETALRKVLACLRLAKSSNPNEAASALRQAKVLMARYGLTDDDAVAAEIREADAGTRYRGAMIPRSVAALANMVADGYRCSIVVHREQGYTDLGTVTGSTKIRFYGAGADAQVAAYAFTVLQRQLAANKAKHTGRIRKRANKDRRGEEFAFGWVGAVLTLFPKEALAAERWQAIDAAIRLRAPGTKKTTAREIGMTGRATDADRLAGYLAGKTARLHSGIEGATQRQLEQA